MEPVKIDFAYFKNILQPLLEELDPDCDVYDNPWEAFESWREDGFSTEQEQTWKEPSLVIFCETIPLWYFDNTSGSWKNAKPGKTDLRVIRVLSSGMVEELGGDGYCEPIEWFKIDDPLELYAYFKLLYKFTEKDISPRKPRKTPTEKLIKDVYVPFYTYEDPEKKVNNTDNKTTWVSSKNLVREINKHMAERLWWMGNTPSPYKLIMPLSSDLDWSCDNTELDFQQEFQTHVDLIKHLSEKNSLDHGITGYEHSLLNIKNRKEHTLDPTESENTLKFNLSYAIAFGGYDISMPIRIQLKENCFTPYFSADINPEYYRHIIDQAIQPFIEDGSNKATTLNLPNYRDQVRLTYELKTYKNQIESLSRRFEKIDISSNTTISFTDYRKRIVGRLQMVRSLAELAPKEEVEIAKIFNPLPIFIEIPLLHWERADERNKYRSGVALLEQTLKTTCLFGLEELHAVRSSIDELKAFPKDMLEGIMGRPSLGHWWSCIENLIPLTQLFPVWGHWIKTIHSFGRKITRLIEARNRIAHPDFVLNPSDIVDAESLFSNVFEELIPTLRNCINNIDILIPLSRKVVRDLDGKNEHVFSALTAKANGLPLPKTKKAYNNQFSHLIVEEELVSANTDSVVPLNHFFKVKDASDASMEILVYNRDFDDDTAHMTSVFSNLGSKETVNQGIFIFG